MKNKKNLTNLEFESLKEDGNSSEGYKETLAGGEIISQSSPNRTHTMTRKHTISDTRHRHFERNSLGSDTTSPMLNPQTFIGVSAEIIRNNGAIETLRMSNM